MLEHLGLGALRQAVPLSRQLIEQAGDGEDLETAEGRARLLAHAKPLWEALPNGALRDQVLGDLAERSRLPREDLARRWGVAGTAARRVGHEPAPRRSAPPRASTRLPQDQVARLLLQRSQWWDDLSSADHALLAALPGWHAELFRWLDRWVHDQGPATWTELREAIATEAWSAQALALVDGAEVPVDPLREDLAAALAQAHRAVQVQEAMRLLGRQ